MDKKIIKYLSLDWGEKRIGLATGDSENLLAVPLGVVTDFKELEKIIIEEGTDIIVLGQPKKMSGKFEPAPSFLKLKRQLEVLGKEVVLWDERLSSRAADALPGIKKMKAERDALAAMLILQSYFDKIKNGRDL